MLVTKFLRKLEGLEVIAELKDGTTARGVLQRVSREMNCKLTGVVILSECGAGDIEIPCLEIRGSQMRIMRLPDDVDVDKLLENLRSNKHKSQEIHQPVHNHEKTMLHIPAKRGFPSSNDISSGGLGNSSVPPASKMKKHEIPLSAVECKAEKIQLPCVPMGQNSKEDGSEKGDEKLT